MLPDVARVDAVDVREGFELYAAEKSTRTDKVSQEKEEKEKRNRTRLSALSSACTSSACGGGEVWRRI